MRTNESVLRDVVQGAVAGAAATIGMEQLNAWLYKQESREAQERYEEVTQGRYVPDRTVEKVDELLHLNLSKEQRRALAMTNHYLMGVGAGVAYALASAASRKPPGAVDSPSASLSSRSSTKR